VNLGATWPRARKRPEQRVSCLSPNIRLVPRRRVSVTLLAPLVFFAASVAQVVIVMAAVNPLANPGANRQLPAFADRTGPCTVVQGGFRCPSPCYPRGVLGYDGSRACTEVLLAAIDQAQAAEHLPVFALPSDYFELSATRQMFVLVNLERISRGVPPLVGLSPYLSAAVTTAARKAIDPPFQVTYGPIQVSLPPGGGDYAFGGGVGRRLG
jgi:hypothetical protein